MTEQFNPNLFGLNKKAQNGLSFCTFEIPQLVPLTWALDPYRKLRYTVKHSVDFHVNSYAYQPEAVLSFFSHTYPTVKVRSATNGNYFRIECMIPEELYWVQKRAEMDHLRRANPGLFVQVFGDLLK